MNKETLTSRVLKHLEEYKSITSMEAFQMFGATRLSAIIFNLRKQGYIIENEWVEAKNRYGDDVRFVNYRLIGSNSLNFERKEEKSINTPQKDKHCLFKKINEFCLKFRREKESEEQN